MSMKFHFFTDWLNAVSILLSLFCVQHHHSTQYNFREEDSLRCLFVCLYVSYGFVREGIIRDAGQRPFFFLFSEPPLFCPSSQASVPTDKKRGNFVGPASILEAFDTSHRID